MTGESAEYRQQIVDIFNPNQTLSSSGLVCLSALGGEELEVLKQAWAEADIERRHEVISQLVHLSETDLKLDFTTTFLLALDDPEDMIRMQAIAGLEGEENHRLVAPLVRVVMEDGSPEVRAAAAVALGKFALLGELQRISRDDTNRLYTALLEVLDSRTEVVDVKRRALEAVAPLNLPRVEELIEEAYHSNDVKLKASALYSMGCNCDPAWVATVVAELSNPEASIRYEAAHACGELGAEEAVPHLIGLVQDEDAEVQEVAIWALGEIGSEQAKETLNKAAESPRPQTREAAESALKEIHLWEDPLSLEP